MSNKIVAKYTKKVQGVLNLEDNTIEVEDYGVLNLKDIFQKFNGELVDITVNFKEWFYHSEYGWIRDSMVQIHTQPTF